MEMPKEILTFESVDEILCCDHSNETSSAELSHGTILILGFYKNEIWDSSWILILGTLGSERVKIINATATFVNDQEREETMLHSFFKQQISSTVHTFINKCSN